MVSFIIALQIDSEDRIKNLSICLNNIKTNFNNCEIVVVELDKESKVNLTEYGVNHIFVRYDDFFSKTMAFNIGVKNASHDIICLYDCDVILNGNTIVSCIKHLNEGMDIMYPYNGMFYDVPKKYHNIIDKEKNLSCVDISECRQLSDRSVGGAVFIKKLVFIEGGGANENIKIGYEDNEIYERFRILGYKIGRMNNPIFHLEHIRLDTSFDYNPYKNQFEKEFIRICNMDKTNLLKEVSSWRK